MTSPKLYQAQPLREGVWRKEQNSMKAIVQDEHGSPDVLDLRDIDIPEINDDEVLVRVHAASVGRDVWHVMAACRTQYVSRATDSACPRTPSSARTWPESWRLSART